MGCSLSAPATGGFSVVSPQCSCMRQAPRKRRGPVADFMGYYSTLFVFCNGGVAGAPDCGVRPDGDGWFCLWRAPSISEGSGLACAVVPPAHPPTFLGTGGLPLYPRRGLRPLHPAWGTRVLSLDVRPPSTVGRLARTCAVVPPAPPGTAVGYRSSPLAPRWAAVASLRWRVWELPNLPLGTGVGGGKGEGCRLAAFSEHPLGVSLTLQAQPL